VRYPRTDEGHSFLPHLDPLKFGRISFGSTMQLPFRQRDRTVDCQCREPIKHLLRSAQCLRASGRPIQELRIDPEMYPENALHKRLQWNASASVERNRYRQTGGLVSYLVIVEKRRRKQFGPDPARRPYVPPQYGGIRKVALVK
jgi:hypothetical protein